MFKLVYMIVSIHCCVSLDMFQFGFSGLTYCISNIQLSLVIINDSKVVNNYNIVNVTFDYTHDRTNDSVMNITFEIFQVVERCVLHLKLNLPENDNDKKFQREFYSTTIDVAKLFKGIFTNFIMRAIMENLAKTIDFEPIFPLTKV